MNEQTFKVAQISDLHVDIQTRPGSYPFTRHSKNHLHRIERLLSEYPYDLLVVSGDLTDWGDKKSLEFVRNWLFGKVEIDGQRFGLEADPKKCVVVPGNHDAYDAQSVVGSIFDRYQKSVENFSLTFPEYSRACT